MSIALGVDWSGGRAARRKIWAARIDLEQRALLRLWRPFSDCRGPEQVAASVSRWLDEQRFDVAGFDFCFGLAAAQLEQCDLPVEGPVALGQALTVRYEGADDFKQAVAPERRRATDIVRRTTLAPTNLRMYRLTYWGLRALASVEAPMPPWSFGEGSVVEVFPGHVRRAIGGNFGLRIAPADRAAIARDHEGDARDAVLAALAAGASFENSFAGTPADAASSGEGWIYSVD
ncbi:MAG TPA: hypothetical protein VFL41_06250 [Gaiellaceae bacterium]|nr:hypothetical protein [Gaiellaceae bacterium]